MRIAIAYAIPAFAALAGLMLPPLYELAWSGQSVMLGRMIAPVVRDAVLDARLHTSPLVRGALRIRSYAETALVDGQGYALGAVGVLHTSPLAAAGLPVDGLARASVCALASLQAGRSKLPREAGTVARPAGWLAEWPGAQADMLGPPGLWIGIRTEGSGRLPWNLGPRRTVRRVAEDSPASRAGFRVGDVLLSIDGLPMRRWDDIENRLSECRAGDVVHARVLRGWRSRLFRVRLYTGPVARQGHTDGDGPR
jgi:S1-C subfamily serine protease